MRSQFAAAIVTTLLGLLALSALGSADEKMDDVLAGWNTDFIAEKPDLAPTGRNPYFILEPGYALILEGGDQRLVISVKDETKKVDGVECRVVEERETKGGKL